VRTGNFENEKGEIINDKAFKARAGKARLPVSAGGSGATAVGLNTIKRAVFFRSLLREQGRGVVEGISSQSNQGKLLNLYVIKTNDPSFAQFTEKDWATFQQSQVNLN